jgi:hypothetical protein
MRFPVFILFSTLIACASGTQKGPTPVFADVIARATNLLEKGSTDKIQYQNVTTDLSRISKETPEYKTEGANAKLAADFMAKFPAVSCELAVTEPDEKLFTATGFASPLVLTTACPVAAPFTFEADSPDIALAAEGFVYAAGKMTAKIRVNSATTESKKNRLRFSAHYYAADFLSGLRGDFDSVETSIIAVNPVEYTIARTPAAAADSYDVVRRSFRKAEFTSSATAGDFGSEVAQSETGQFTIGGVYSGQKFDLTYGHPNGTLPDGIGTTFTTVRIDGTDYRFEEQRMKRMKADDGTLVCEAKMGKTGIVVTQTLKPEDAKDPIKTRIGYLIRNSSKKVHQVGIRLMLDTWAGKNDGVPFLLPTGETQQHYRSEVEFTPTVSVMWQIYDTERGRGGASEPGLQNILVGKDLVPPDRVALANWPNAVNSVWDYAVSSDRRITGDSAVLLWWHPAEIKPAATQTIATELGAFADKREPAVFVTNPDSGDLLVYLWHFNTGSETEQISYTVRATNGSFTYYVEKDAAELKPGEVFIRANPAQVLAEGASTIIVTETINGRAKEYKFPIENLKMWKKFRVAPLVEPAKNFPVSYFDERELALTARLKNAGGKILQSINLNKEAINGGFQYTGNFQIPADAIAGRYTVEVVR